MYSIHLLDMYAYNMIPVPGSLPPQPPLHGMVAKSVVCSILEQKRGMCSAFCMVAGTFADSKPANS